ncbi:Ent-kaurene synthase [Musa troglodytarum]|uniref:Ent-kaurene synthase n=1 Tax=Musa troglodytarum TaxID=320322 RepID=A0A9E7HYH7_9LILI|nr:Ent-kaurene synthase [Musa troglodytarum]
MKCWTNSNFPVVEEAARSGRPGGLLHLILTCGPGNVCMYAEIWMLSVSVSQQDKANGADVSLFMRARGCGVERNRLVYLCAMNLAIAHSPSFPVLAASARSPSPSCDSRSSIPVAGAAKLDHGCKKHTSGNGTLLCSNGPMERIREHLQKIELSASSYDTAWVAMVPSPMSPQRPCFPQCLNWILDNQHPDGSWGLHHIHPSLIIDGLSSTLACILALERWKSGQEHVRRGLSFIESNFSRIVDEQLHSPIGFDIIFPGMVEYALNIGLEIPIDQSDINNMLCKRDAELQREQGNNCEGRKAYLAYVAEGLANILDWREIMKYQRENGSLFNSPSTTAAALMHIYDAKALEYLRSLLLRCWLLNDEEISSDMATCAMAFRLLRMNGYDVSSDCFTQFSEVNYFYNSLQGYLKDVSTVLELYKASQIKISPNELVLDKLGSWSRDFLKQALISNQKLGLQVALQEVDYALNFPFYANLECLEHKRNIENFGAEKFHVLKTSYQHCGINDNNLLRLALEDFCTSQSIYRKELQNLEDWVKENKLDQLEFARQKQAYCYFSAAATLFSPEMSEARMSWAKNSILTTVVDDFFDFGGSREELESLISLVEKWDGTWKEESCSEQVKIIFSALFNTINEHGIRASALQQRSITHHLVEIWLTLMKSMMKEAEWTLNKEVPSLDEYMLNGYVSFALGPIILPALYFVGPQLPEYVVNHPEYQNLLKLREGKEGKLNSVSLRILRSHGSASEEEVKKEMQRAIDGSRTELLRLVLQQDGSVVPRPCKDLFWKMCRILHVFYMKTDGFTSPKEMLGAVNSVIHEPLKVSHI